MPRESRETFRPSCDAFEPLSNLNDSNIKYKAPADRKQENLASQRGSVSNLNSDDSLRRVSVVIHRHILICESRINNNYHKQRSPMSDGDSQQLSPVMSDVSVHSFQRRASSISGGGIKPPPRYRGQLGIDNRTLENTSEMLHEDIYIKAEWKYTFIRLPRLPLWTSYRMVQVQNTPTTPSVEMIYSFIRHLFVEAQLSSECSVVCLVYIERLMEKANVELMPYNWRPITLCGMLLASKVWQDLSSWNIEFARVYPQFSLKSINNLERTVLRLLQWDLYISGAVYAKYYFALRSLNESSNFRKRYNYIMRVNNVEAKLIEQRSSAAAGNAMYSKSM